MTHSMLLGFVNLDNASNTPEACPHPISIPSGFTRIASNNVCTVFASGKIFTPENDGGFAIVGNVYSDHGTYPELKADALSRLTYSEIEQERGIWGDFIGISSHEGKVHVYRSAMGRLPLYIMQMRERIVFASSIPLLRALPGVALSIDWPGVAHHLLFRDQRVRRTCLEGLEEAFGGEAVVLSPAGVQIYRHWSPWDCVSADKGWKRDKEAHEAIRSTVLQTVARLSGNYSHIVLAASGGLDSSIVASALAVAGRSVTLANLVTPDGRGDERTYARVLSRQLGFGLIERFEDPALVNPLASNASHLPRPVARSFAQSADAILSDIAKSQNADAHFTGAGGDNVFCFIQSATPVADLLLKGRLARATRCARDIGVMTGAGVFKAMSLGIQRAFLRTTLYQWPADTRFLLREAHAIASSVEEHPWLRIQREGMPGSCAHVASLLAIENHLEGFRRELTTPVISPLMAKPIVEAALSIPPWMWCRDGRNRSVARDAFAGLLPAPLLARTGKGTPSGFAAHIFAIHSRAIREFLCDGALSNARIIDKDAVSAAIIDNAPFSGNEYSRLLLLCDAEAWIRCQQSSLAS